MAPMWQNVSYFYRYFSMCIIFKNIIFKKSPRKKRGNKCGEKWVFLRFQMDGKDLTKIIIINDSG